MSYILVAKPTDHKILFEWVDELTGLGDGHRIELKMPKGKRHVYEWINGVPLNGQDHADNVNFFQFKIMDKTSKVTYKNSWVTSLDINDGNVAHIAQAGRCRWKIENECFNTLKNQGYYLEHNFGHGKKQLSHNLYLLTMLAFFFHQIFELTDPAYQLCRRSLGSKRLLWETFRVLIRYFVFETWNQTMLKVMSGRGGIPFLEKTA